MVQPISEAFVTIVPILTVVVLVINILKEALQLITEGTGYIAYENFIDLIVYILVSIL